MNTENMKIQDKVLSYFDENNKDARILVVDDTSVGRHLSVEVMKLLGFKNFETANDGKKAWDLMVEGVKAGKPFHLVISDWMMPIMNGLELLKKVRASGWDMLPPFVLMSSETDSNEISTAMEEGATAYVKKPINEKNMRILLSHLNPPQGTQKK